MSLGARNPFKQKSARSSRSPIKSDLVQLDAAPVRRRPYGTKGDVLHGPEGILYAPGGPYSQPVDPGHDTQRSARGAPETDNHDTFAPIADFSDKGRPISRKKAKQWENWQEKVIPSMLEPYIQLLCQTQSLRNLPTLRQNPPAPNCECGVHKSSLQVSCIYLESTLIS
jgi:hypothetical protein